MSKKYSRDPNRQRRIWDAMDDNGATPNELALHLHTKNTAITSAVNRMIQEGVLRREGAGRSVRYFKNPSAQPPEIIGNDYAPGIVDMAETVGTHNLLDALETHILEMDTATQAAMELIVKLKPLLITNELIDELRELRAIKKQVENALKII